MNTCVKSIARRQARLGGFAPSLSPSPKALADENDNDGANEDEDEDEDEDASSSSNDEMMTSRGLALCHSRQKGEVVLDESSFVLRGRVSIGYFC